MSILIRSQDKEALISVGDVSFLKIVGNSIRVIPINHTEMFETIGIYETKERCIKVLDEIQKLASNYKCREGFTSITTGEKFETIFFIPPKVYEMPKE